MKSEGKRVSAVRWIHAGTCIVGVEVEAVLPTDEPSGPCYGPEQVDFLREVHQCAEAGDADWLKIVGDVYVRRSA